MVTFLKITITKKKTLEGLEIIHHDQRMLGE